MHSGKFGSMIKDEGHENALLNLETIHRNSGRIWRSSKSERAPGIQDRVVGAARAHPDTDVFEVSKGLREQAAVDLMAVDVDEGAGGPTRDDAKEDATAAAAEALAQTANPDRDLHSFEIIPEKVWSIDGVSSCKGHAEHGLPLHKLALFTI